MHHKISTIVKSNPKSIIRQKPLDARRSKCEEAGGPVTLFWLCAVWSCWWVHVSLVFVPLLFLVFGAHQTSCPGRSRAQSKCSACTKSSFLDTNGWLSKGGDPLGSFNRKVETVLAPSPDISTLVLLWGMKGHFRVKIAVQSSCDKICFVHAKHAVVVAALFAYKTVVEMSVPVEQWNDECKTQASWQW